ncbi:MAG TPA: hypothetical protein VH643_32920 [Gemmataceae bacterium]
MTALNCPAGAIVPAFTDLREHYSAAQRHYHTLDHIRAVLDTIRALGGTEAMPSLLLAVWFHDVIYDSRAHDNEEKSAAHARRILQQLGVSEAILSETERLILLTTTHSPAPGDAPGAILADADLAILGAPETEYDMYAQAIRREYAWVPEARYREGRRAVLEHFLRRPRIYATAEMFTRAETAARNNIRREVAALG